MSISISDDYDGTLGSSGDQGFLGNQGPISSILSSGISNTISMSDDYDGTPRFVIQGPVSSTSLSSDIVSGVTSTSPSKSGTCNAIFGGNNSCPNNATNCMIIGEGINLKSGDVIKNAVYLGGNSKVFLQTENGYIDLVEKIKFLEEKLNMLLYAPNGPYFEMAKNNFNTLAQRDPSQEEYEETDSESEQQ